MLAYGEAKNEIALTHLQAEIRGTPCSSEAKKFGMLEVVTQDRLVLKTCRSEKHLQLVSQFRGGTSILGGATTVIEHCCALEIELH